VASSSDRAHLEAIYRAQFPALMRTAFLMTGSNAVAEDLVHDVFLRCVDRLNAVSEPSSYLRAAVVNACRREYRRRSRLTSIDGDVGTTDMPAASVDLQRALARLSGRMRAAVVLRFLVDLPFDDVARALGCRPSTARSLVRRAMTEMKEVLDGRR